MNGTAILLTGLSGSGKTTVADALTRRLDRPVTVLDGDVVREHLSTGLGFSRADRLTNMRRVAWVASEIVRHGGLVVCPMIAPYADGRHEMRQIVERYGRFVEIYIDTPFAVCESRDTKGLYAKARAGQIARFTGLDDPYEVPTCPDLRLDWRLSVGEMVERSRDAL